MTIRTTEVSARGLQFRVRTAGPDDGRPVLLLHGFPQHGGEWDRMVPALVEAGCRTIAPDQRGYSPGARPEGKDAYRVSEIAQDAMAIAAALGADGPVDVIGHDWGAIAAWHLAAHHADRVRTLTAVSVPHPTAYTRALKRSPDQMKRSAYLALFRLPKAERVLLADGAKRLRAVFGDAGLSAAEVDDYLAPLLEPGGLTGALNWYRAMDGIGDIGPVEVPTTYVWSTEDMAVGRVAAEGCGEQVSGEYQFVELPGISHWIPDQAPDEVVTAALQRITGVTSSGV